MDYSENFDIKYNIDTNNCYNYVNYIINDITFTFDWVKTNWENGYKDKTKNKLLVSFFASYYGTFALTLLEGPIGLIGGIVYTAFCALLVKSGNKITYE